MLSVVVAIPSVFGLLVWRSYRLDALRASRGEGFVPKGKIRWRDTGSTDSAD